MASPKVLLVIVCVFLLGCTHNASSKHISELKREILDHILPKNTNEILISPGNSTNGATVVEVSMYVFNIDKLNEQNLDFTVRVYLRQKWKDERLKYDNKGQINYIEINDPDAIWTPDTFFLNEKKGHTYEILHPNVCIRIFPDGSILYSRKISATLSCLLNFKRFPFDKQTCEVHLETYGTTADDVVLLWKAIDPVDVSSSLYLPLFSLEKFVTYSGVNSFSTGTFSRLTLSFYLTRNADYYITHIYIPLTWMVILSWVPFWLNKKVLTARLLINVAALLAWTLIINEYNRNQIKLSYVTCMDCFIGTCLTFVLFSIIETVIVYMVVEKEKSDSKHDAENGDVHKEQSHSVAAVKVWIKKLPFKTNYIDAGSRVIIPFMYLVFCIVYFTSVGLSKEDPISITGNQFKETLFTSVQN